MRLRGGDATARPEAESLLGAIRSRSAGSPETDEIAAALLIALFRPDEVRPLVAPRLDRDDVDPAVRARLALHVALADAWSADLLQGERGALAARDLASRHGDAATMAAAAGVLAKIEALRGRAALSRAHIAEAMRLAGDARDPWVANGLLEVQATLFLVTGDTEAWAALLSDLVKDGQGAASALAVEYRLELATVHALAGHHDAAVRTLATPVPSSPHWPGAGAWAAWESWVRSIDDDAALAGLVAAARQLTLPSERYLRARLEWLAGAQYGRRGHRGEAVALLRSAQRTYAAIGASGFVDCVEAALSEHLCERPRVAGDDAVPAALTALSTAERRVAQAVQSGLSNREVAAALFLSVRTVEFHLAHIYRKLGIRNRADLVRRA